MRTLGGGEYTGFIDGLDTVIGVPGPPLDISTSPCFEQARKRSVSAKIFKAPRAALAWTLFSSASTSTKASKNIKGSNSFRLVLALDLELTLAIDESIDPSRPAAGIEGLF